MSELNPNSPRCALLPDRGVVRVAGEDAEKLLQGIVTNDVGLLASQPALHCALLTPQGKILFDMIAVKTPAGLMLEVALDKAPELAKRLVMYRLRAKAEIADVSADYVVQALWGKDAGCPCNPGYPDPRHPALGLRMISQRQSAADDASCSNCEEASAEDYHAHRIAFGVPEGGKDYDYGDAFPHEADFDLFHGVSFKKGCYVGQEVVARMQHKALVRKRVVRVTSATALPPSRPDVKAGDVVIGKLGSVARTMGLAMLRLDRVLEFQGKGVTITCDGIALTIDQDALSRYEASAAERN